MFGTMLNLLVKFLPTRLPRLLTERPDLLVDHALAYAALAKSEIESVKREWIRRVVAGAFALASALAFIVLSGVSVMLHVTTQAHADVNWVLWAVPGAMLLVTLVAIFVALSKGEPRSDTLGAQLQLDLQSFRAVMESRS
jgi:hypothetical protein